MAAFSTKFMTRSERSIRPSGPEKNAFPLGHDHSGHQSGSARQFECPSCRGGLTKSPSRSAADKTCPDRSVRGPWTTPLLCFDLEKESLSFVGVIIRFVGRAAGVPVRIVDKREA